VTLPSAHNIFIYGALAVIAGIVGYFGWMQLGSLEATDAANAEAAAAQANTEQEAVDAQDVIGSELLSGDSNTSSTSTLTSGAASVTTSVAGNNLTGTEIAQFPASALTALSGPVASIPAPNIGTVA
jgi:hypothetical protein